MIKNPNSVPGYCEEYDGEALRELVEMAKMYVARECGLKAPECGVPDGSFSDFSCNVWEMMTELIRYGIWLGNKKRTIELNESMARRLTDKIEEIEVIKNDPNGWRKPILED